jgi:hypothetical protein
VRSLSQGASAKVSSCLTCISQGASRASAKALAFVYLNSGSDKSGSDDSGHNNSGPDSSGSDNAGSDNFGSDISGSNHSGSDFWVRLYSDNFGSDSYSLFVFAVPCRR